MEHVVLEVGSVPFLEVFNQRLVLLAREIRQHSCIG